MSTSVDESHPDQRQSREEIIEFILQLGRALHFYGTPAHRLEEAMTLCSQELAVPGEFFATPTAIFASFPCPGQNETRLLRVGPGMVDLDKLMQVDAVMNEVCRGEVRAAEGERRLDSIEAQPPLYGRSVRLLAYGFASGSAGLLLGGGVYEMLFGALAGLLIGWLAEVVGRSRTSISMVEPLGAMVAAGGALLWGAYVTPLDVNVATVASLILLVPGFTLTVAMNELATRNLLSGTARLMFAVMVLLGIGFGVAVGRQIAPLLPEAQVVLVAPIPLWLEVLALLAAGPALAVCFRAPLGNFVWIQVSCVLAYGGVQAVLIWEQPPEIAAFFGALLVGLGSSVFARVFDRPAAVTQVPGIMLLVPGSIGLRGVAHIVDKQTLSGVDAAFLMVLVGTAIVTGLLVSNVLVSPRKVL